MYNITLIGTAHSKIGKCDSDELDKIFESLSPEVIFLEMTKNLYQKIYLESQVPNDSPELKSLKNYSIKYKVEHVPVDIEPNRNLRTSEIDFMFKTFKKYNIYKDLDSEQNKLTARDGFSFLNSKECAELINKKKEAEWNLMQFDVNKNILMHTHKLFYEEQDNRESAWLQNIQNFSNENRYSQAVFLFGSGHRNSIMKKLNEYRSDKKSQLNWTFYKGT